MTQDPSDKDATFFVSTDTEIKSGKARKTKTYVHSRRETEDKTISVFSYILRQAKRLKLRIIQRMQIRLT